MKKKSDGKWWDICRAAEVPLTFDSCCGFQHLPTNMLLFYILSVLMRFVWFCNHESWDVMLKLLDFNETNETDLRILRLGRVYCVAQVAHPLQKEPPMMRNSGTSSTARGPRMTWMTWMNLGAKAPGCETGGMDGPPMWPAQWASTWTIHTFWGWSCDPHPGTLFWHSFWHTIWKYTWHIYWHILTFYLAI